jgi:hypothetical protein
MSETATPVMNPKLPIMSAGIIKKLPIMSEGINKKPISATSFF